MKLATIGIPTFNRETFLRQAVASALAQTYGNLEVVVCDNASTDGTEAFCRSIAAHDQRVRYIRQAENVGALGNFESSLANAQGEYFMWLADDDWLDTNYIAECVRVLEDGARLVAGQAQWYGDAVEEPDEPPITLLGRSPTERVRAYYWAVNHNSVFYGLARTSELRRLMPFPRPTGGDWLIVAASALAGTVWTLDATTLHRASGGASDAISDRRSIPPTVVHDILRARPYEELGRLKRAELALRCGGIVGWRLWLRAPILAGFRKHSGEAAYVRLRAIYRKFGRERSRGEMMSSGTDGQSMASDGSSQRTPDDAAGSKGTDI